MRVRMWFKWGRTTPNGKRICVRKLPVRQTLMWLGPLFVVVQPKRIKAKKGGV